MWGGGGGMTVLLVWFGICVVVLGYKEVRAQEPTAVRGQIVDGDDRPLAFANVQLIGTTVGATSQLDGSFRFLARRQGVWRLRASFIGYESAYRGLHLVPGDTVVVHLVLRRKLIELGETIVATSTYSTGDAETVTLSLLEVVTTPGASADIFRAFQSLPGVAAVGDGAGLYVRGGDVSETLVLLDQATLTHPYRFESSTGGMFGTISPFEVKGTVFSTGGCWSCRDIRGHRSAIRT